MVAFNGEINAGRDATKTNTYHLQTFRTRDLGFLDPDKIEYYRTPHRRHTVNSEFNLSDVQSLPYVEVAYIHTGTRPGVASAMVGLGAKGIVIASVGAGSPGSLDKEFEDTPKNRRAVVVQSSRVGEERIVRNNNWYEPGMVVADNLSPQKAAILLSLALTKTPTRTTYSAYLTNIEGVAGPVGPPSIRHRKPVQGRHRVNELKSSM